MASGDQMFSSPRNVSEILILIRVSAVTPEGMGQPLFCAWIWDFRLWIPPYINKALKCVAQLAWCLHNWEPHCLQQQAKRLIGVTVSKTPSRPRCIAMCSPRLNLHIQAAILQEYCKRKTEDCLWMDAKPSPLLECHAEPYSKQHQDQRTHAGFVHQRHIC